MVDWKWIVADMDSTLVDRPASGLFPTLKESPCFAPVVQSLSRGVRLCVVTTADYRSFMQVWNCIPEELRKSRQLVMALSEGGSLIYGDDNGLPVLDLEYQEKGIRGGTLISEDTCKTLLELIRSIVVGIFAAFQKDRSLIDLLTTKYHVPLNRALDVVEEQKITLEEYLTPERLTTRGSVMTETNEALVSFNRPRISGLERVHLGGAGSVSIMAMPRAIGSSYYEHLRPQFEALGVELSAAPNSLWIKKNGVNKATPLHWLASNAQYSFSFETAIAFGDSPHTNDMPLSQLGSLGMPFVSVAADASVIPPHVSLHVGGLEWGTSLVLEAMLQELGEHRLGHSCGGWDAILNDVVARCRALVSEKEQKEGTTGEWVHGREV